MTVQEIKNNHQGFFFTRETLKFFGDTMKSFGCRKFEGKYYLYRKPSAFIKNLRGERVKAGRKHFVAYEVTENFDLDLTNEELTTKLYEVI